MSQGVKGVADTRQPSRVNSRTWDMEDEMDARDQVREQILGDAGVPFSFVYDGRRSETFIKNWERRLESKKLDENKTSHILTFTDEESGLQVACEAIEYADFPALDWVMRFRNNGQADSAVLEDVLPLDVAFGAEKESNVFLHYPRGSSATREDFSPVEVPLTLASSKTLGCMGGRSSNAGDAPPDNEGAMPFFNLQFDDGGIILAIGWSGSWKAQFERDTQSVLSVQGGMEHTRLKLLAGEEIRTPRILMLSWEGARLKAHNQFRKLVLAHYTPLQAGKPVQMPFSANSWSLHNCGSEVSEENQIDLIRKYKAKKIPLECYWLDAGWYEGVDGVERWGECVGNWSPKKRTFPNGFRALADEVAKAGLGFVLWFEPERAKPGTQMYEEFPQWMIMPDEDIIKARRKTLQWEQPWTDKVEALPDFGNPQLREWFTDHVSSMIEEYGVTVFRQDFNFDPAAYWRLADGEDREGITEIRFIEGLYEFWEELVRRHPGLLIDNCASGGRRIDLETMARSVALHRTDNAGEPEAAQSQTMGINLYYPCAGTGIFADSGTVDRYYFRSCLAAGMQIAWDIYSDDLDSAAACEIVEEFKLLRPLYYGDFYPLTVENCSRISDVWCAYQLHREDLNQGAVVAFRRENSPYPVAKLKLHGLDAAGTYECTDIDTDAKTVFTGEELMEEGLEIVMAQAPDSKIFMLDAIRDHR